MRRSWVLFIAALLALPAGGCSHQGSTPESRVYYTGPVTDHFNGETFFNPEGEQGSGGAQNRGKAHFLAIATGKAGYHAWPKSVPVTPSVPPRRVDGNRMLVTWIGHATVLVQTQGLNILLDPVWAHRDSPVQLVGPRRVRAAGVRIEDMPPVDLVLISHNHYDHLDIGALKRLAARDRTVIVAGLGNDTLLARHGLQVTALDWGGRFNVRPGIDVILERAHHWSAHWTDDHDRALWSGFTVTLPGGNLYYAGDTGPGDMNWVAQAGRSGAIRLAILPIGPDYVNDPPTGNHINAAEAVAAFRQLGAAYALGVHWGTFELSDAPIDMPPARLGRELARYDLDPARFRTLEAGEAWEIPGTAPPPK